MNQKQQKLPRCCFMCWHSIVVPCHRQKAAWPFGEQAEPLQGRCGGRGGYFCSAEDWQPFLLGFEMLLDSVLELGYRKIVLNQNFGDGSIKIGLEGTLRSLSNNCARVKHGSAVLENLWRWKC